MSDLALTLLIVGSIVIAWALLFAALAIEDAYHHRTRARRNRR